MSTTDPIIACWAVTPQQRHRLRRSLFRSAKSLVRDGKAYHAAYYLRRALSVPRPTTATPGPGSRP